MQHLFLSNVAPKIGQTDSSTSPTSINIRLEHSITRGAYDSKKRLGISCTYDEQKVTYIIHYGLVPKLCISNLTAKILDNLQSSRDTSLPKKKKPLPFFVS